MIRSLLAFSFILLFFTSQSQKVFDPIPDSIKPLYKFDLQKNFFDSQETFNAFLHVIFQRKIISFNDLLKQPTNPKNLSYLTTALSNLEYDFRKMDLYLFLEYAVNTKNEKASELEDSIYGVMVTVREKFKATITSASADIVKEWLQLPSMQPYLYYSGNIIRNKPHDLTDKQLEALKPFNSLRSGRYYDELTANLPTDTVFADTARLDLFKNMGDWRNHPDEKVRQRGDEKLFKSYGTIKQQLGFKYIQMIKALDAFAQAKKYKSLIEENASRLALADSTIEKFFSEIEANSSLFKEASQRSGSNFTRYSITTSIQILLNSFRQLGNEYYSAAMQLLDANNGRLDVVGGPDRLGLQGVASVYPVDVSVFFANNYLGYYIDIMVLAHEAGHAIQASLMKKNKVSLLNSAGPGYFTESFGRFNELVVSYHLAESAITSEEKKFYRSKYIERLVGLFGSAREASIEYKLVKGIINSTISKPSDLDSITSVVSAAYGDNDNSPWKKGLWMLLETNYKAPLHNVNDMLAAILCVQYFKLFLNDKKTFALQYQRFLKNGYTDTPAILLKKFMGINLNDEKLCKEAIEFIRSELQRLK